MADPKITAVINTYNHKQYIGKAIRSVLAQTLCPVEIIVVDDGSTDGTQEAVRREFGDRVLYHYQEERGIGGSRNAGTRLSSGDWIAFLDSDDHWAPEKLQLQAAEIVPGRNIAMVACWGLECTPDDRILGELTLPQPLTKEVIRSELRRRCLFSPSGVLMRRDALLEVGGFPEDLMFGEDLVTFSRLAASYEIVAVHRPLFYKTQLPRGLSSRPAAVLRDGLISFQRSKEALASRTWPRSWLDHMAFRQSETQLFLHTAWLYAKSDKRLAMSTLLNGLIHWPFLTLWQYRSIYWLCMRLVQRGDSGTRVVPNTRNA